MDELTVLSPFLDQQGADFLAELYSLCAGGVRRSLICRPLNEPECGNAIRRRAADFKALGVSAYEYAFLAPDVVKAILQGQRSDQRVVAGCG
jgi:hypothetical protein